MADKRKAKKPTKRKKRNKKKKSHFIASVKRILFWVLILTIGFIALMFLFDYLYPEKEIDTPSKEQVQDIPNTQSSVNTVYFIEKGEIPKPKGSQKEQIIYHEGYTVSYCVDNKIANWVAWELTSDKVRKNIAKRSDVFVPDPKVKGCVVHTNDYKKSGYDRGHLAPAADMRWSEVAMKESFYLSNVCPQEPALNRGVWKSLEEQTRLWALDFDTLWIVAGPVVADNMKRIGKNGIGVPPHFYKVICTISDNNYQGIAFLLENKGCDQPLQALAIPIDSVEKVTGLDFFYKLPVAVQERMESTVHLSSWSF